MATEQGKRRVQFGQTVYDADGEKLGRVRDVQESGFYATTVEGVSTASQAERQGRGEDATVALRRVRRDRRYRGRPAALSLVRGVRREHLLLAGGLSRKPESFCRRGR
jgi:hypothetical protein